MGSISKRLLSRRPHFFYINAYIPTQCNGIIHINHSLSGSRDWDIIDDCLPCTSIYALNLAVRISIFASLYIDIFVSIYPSCRLYEVVLKAFHPFCHLLH